MVHDVITTVENLHPEVKHINVKLIDVMFDYKSALETD
jgi:hypothetical protein